MKGKVYQYYTELPQWAKGVVVVGLTGIVVLVGLKIYRKLSPSKDELDQRKFMEDVNNDVTKFKSEGDKQTFPDSAYMQFANTIYDGMRYAVGDDYGAVVDTCKKMMTNLDVALLIKAFGVRQNYIFGIPGGNPMDMLTFIKDELGSEFWFVDRIGQINRDWNSKGIKYRV